MNNILKALCGDLNNVSAISGFQTGIEVQGTNAILNGFVLSGNAGDGLQIKSDTCSVMSFASDSNGGNGVTISGSSGCQLNAFIASGNAGVGVALINAKSTTLTDFNADDSDVPGGNAGGGITLTGSFSNTISNFAAENNAGPGVTLTNSIKNWVFSFDATGSTSSSGVELSGSLSNSIFDFTTLDNAFYGVWLAASSSNSVRFGLALGNTLAGVYLGCGASGVGSCSPGGKPSSKIIVTAMIAGDDAGASLPQAYGVAVDLGDLKNNISGITATGDTTQDLDDENASCGTNTWFANAGIKVKPACTEP